MFLLGTNTKLAPLTLLTIPRLERNAALLLARWINCLKTVLKSQLNIKEVFGWTDSFIILSWLTNAHESFKVYVSNLTHQIVSLLPDCTWFHVRSQHKPPDCTLRGLMPSELVVFSLYWRSPKFIRDDPKGWCVGVPLIPLNELLEARPISIVIQPDELPTEWFNAFSSYDNLTRIVARMYRFVN